MQSIKRLIRAVPGARRLKQQIDLWAARLQLKRKPIEQVFSDIYENNKWGSEESVSGPGSSMDQTRVVRTYLANLIDRHGIRSIFDIPCGDFNWMSRVDLSKVHYTGADIVPELIRRNAEKFGSDNVRFVARDLTSEPIDRVDLILCRDCLMHLSNAQVVRALKNICNSSSRFLLTTGFTDTSRNGDIAHGQWRPINLTAAPFSLCQPLEIVNEELRDYGGRHSDKSMMLWDIDAIRTAVQRLR